ncbi:hypothetical protein L1887_14723 [Cichorium endivia]|nr:hypothetical protein L1887_14723 [Cichorium endivia]
MGFTHLTANGCSWFFEVLIGARAEALWQLLSKVRVLYTLETIFTVIFVVNMNTIWEKVMSSLRAQIFGSILIHKVEFFDKYKVGEFTALLTTDLGSFKNIVSENISGDRRFRALTEASYSTLNKSCWDNVVVVCYCPSACTNFRCTYAWSIYFSWILNEMLEDDRHSMVIKEGQGSFEQVYYFTMFLF